MTFTATGKAKLKSDFIHFHKSCRKWAVPCSQYNQHDFNSNVKTAQSRRIEIRLLSFGSEVILFLSYNEPPYHSYFLHEQCQEDVSPCYQTLHFKKLPFTVNGLKE